MGDTHPSEKIEADGLPSADVSFYPASPEQLQAYHDAREALHTYKASVQPLVQSNNPHERLFVAAFDGTGNDRDQHPDQKTNVARLDEQLEILKAEGNEHIYTRYRAGPGTQANPVARVVDGALGFTSDHRVEEMYKEAVDKANAWHLADPHVQIRVLSTGFSRGGSQAAAFTNVLHKCGIPDYQSRVVGPNGEITYTKHIVAPGQIRQSVMLFDPVSTGFPMEMDRRLPPSVTSGVQITALDERRALFPSDRIIAPGLSEDGRFLGLSVPGAHSDIGGSYARNGLGLRSCNFAIDYCNALSDKPLLRTYAEPNDPHLNVVHRSEEGNLIFRLDRKVDRLQPEGINLRQGATSLGPEVANTVFKAAGVVGAATVAVEATTTTAHTIDLLDRHNVPGAQSGIVHFGTRNIGAVGGATLGAEAFGAAGAETGPFDVVIAGAGALVGGGLGAVAGDKIANAYDNHRIYNQTDPHGTSWHYDPAQPQQGWTRDLPPLPHAPHGQHLTADPALAARLTYQANTTAVELAMARPPAPRDPYTQPADAHDSHSLTDAPWTRDAQTRQWSRHVVDQVMEHGMQRTHDETASPARAAQLDAAAQQTIAANLANSPRGIAEQYQAMYQQHDGAPYGPMPQDVATALRNPANTLQASDGHTYTRQPDGQWHTPGRLWGTYAAEGNVRAELNATFASVERQHDAQAPAEPAKTVDAPTTAPSAEYLAASAAIERIATAMERGDRDTLRKEYEAFTQSPHDQAAMQQARATVQREEQQRILQESQQPPRDPRDARHPDHALNQSIRDHVETLHCKAGIFIGNKTLDHLTASVALNAREQGLSRVDQLHFNADRTAIVAEQKSNGLDMSHKLSSTNIQQAMQTPPEHAYRQMAHETQRQADVQQAIQQQIAQSRQAPSQGR